MTTATDRYSKERIESLRIQKYKKNRGVFLIHTWKPSDISDQEAEITISIRQHLDGPLSGGKVESVEYHMGPKFPATGTVVEDDASNFALIVHAYYPMLCFAVVVMKDGSDGAFLERYIDFDC